MTIDEIWYYGPAAVCALLLLPLLIARLIAEWRFYRCLDIGPQNWLMRLIDKQYKDKELSIGRVLLVLTLIFTPVINAVTVVALLLTMLAPLFEKIGEATLRVLDTPIYKNPFKRK